MKISGAKHQKISFYRCMAKGALERGFNIKPLRQTVGHLALFAASNPSISQAFWRKLEAEVKNTEADRIFFPAALARRPDIIKKAPMIPFSKMVEEKAVKGGTIRVLDLRKMPKLASMLGPAGITEEELQNLSILSELSRIYFKQYLSFLKKGKAGREGDETNKEICQDDLKALMNEVPWIVARLESVKKPYRKEIAGHLKDALRLHEMKNDSAAVVSLLAAWKKLEVEAEVMERKRLAARADGKKRIGEIVGKTLNDMDISSFGIKMNEDGTWLVPQKGWKIYDGVAIKETLVHRVNNEDVVRRTAHIIENIENEFDLGTKHINTLKSAIFWLQNNKNMTEKDKESIKNMIIEPLERYSKAIIRKKKTAADRLEITLGLLGSGLIRQAISMLNMAVCDLEDRNAALGAQKIWFERKGRVESEELVRRIKNDENIKSKLRYAVRIFGAWRIKENKRMSGTAAWLEDKVVPLVKKGTGWGYKNAVIAVSEAAKALKQASNWSARKPGWIKHQNIPADKIDIIADRNTRTSIIKAAKWLMIAEWCIEHKYEKQMTVKELANIWKGLAEPNASYIEAIERII